MTLMQNQTMGLTGMAPEARALLKTTIDAATALARLLPNGELEQGFEFPWGHSNSYRAQGIPRFRAKTKKGRKL